MDRYFLQAEFLRGLPARVANDDHAVLVDDRDAAWEGDEPVIRMLDAVERAAGLRELADLSGHHAKGHRRLRLLLRDVDGADPGVVHPVEGLQVRARVDNRDAHLRAEFHGLGAGRLDGLMSVFDSDVHDRVSLSGEAPSVLALSCWSWEPSQALESTGQLPR